MKSPLLLKLHVKKIKFDYLFNFLNLELSIKQKLSIQFVWNVVHPSVQKPLSYGLAFIRKFKES